MRRVERSFSGFLNPLPKRPTVIETLVGQILSLVKEAGLQPGDKLPSEKEIITATGASRPSVREALRALKTMRVIESRPGQGSFLMHFEAADVLQSEAIVLALMHEDFREIVQARAAIECEIVALVARHGHREISAARGAIEKMTSRADAGLDIYEAAWDFHLAIAEAGGNSVMVALLSMLHTLIRQAQLTVYWPKIDLRQEIESHWQLYRDITSGDEERARRAMRNHLDQMLGVAERSPAIEEHRVPAPTV